LFDDGEIYIIATLGCIVKLLKGLL
jgi:hypothetical protein